MQFLSEEGADAHVVPVDARLDVLPLLLLGGDNVVLFLHVGEPSLFQVVFKLHEAEQRVTRALRAIGGGVRWQQLVRSEAIGVAARKRVARPPVHLTKLGELVLELREHEIDAVPAQEGHVALHALALRLRTLWAPCRRLLCLRRKELFARGIAHAPCRLEQLSKPVEQPRLDQARRLHLRQRVQQRLDCIGHGRLFELELLPIRALPKALFVAHHLHHRVGRITHLKHRDGLQPHARRVLVVGVVVRVGARARLQKVCDRRREPCLLGALGTGRLWNLAFSIVHEERDRDLHEIAILLSESRACRFGHFALLALLVHVLDVGHAHDARKAAEGMHQHLLIASHVHLVSLHLLVHELDEHLNFVSLEALSWHRRKALHRLDAQRVIRVAQHPKDDLVARVLVEELGHARCDLKAVVWLSSLAAQVTVLGLLVVLGALGERGHHAHESSEHLEHGAVIDRLNAHAAVLAR